MATIFDIARYFVLKEPMTLKKLMALCYYTQAWSLTLKNKLAFEGEFQAWVHGPCNPELFEKFKAYLWDLIDVETFDNIMKGNDNS